MLLAIVLALLCARNSVFSSDNENAIPSTRPMVIAHRGASGRYPEMTPVSFERAVEEGADSLECDLAVTSDFHIVCSHESWMTDNTNVADVFPSSRMNTYFVDDQNRLITDYFIVDFTLEELTTIKKRQRYTYRDTSHDDLYPMATLEQCIQIAQNAGRPVQVLAEIKEAIWINSLEFMQNASVTIESLLLDVFAEYGYTDANSPAAIQCFNHDVIKGLRSDTQLDLSFLIGNIIDTTDEKFTEFATYASTVALAKDLVVIQNSNDQIIARTDVIDRAHAAGLSVNIWTFRNEDRYLAWDYGQDIYNEMQDFLNLGTNGFITDFTETGVRFLNINYNCTV